MRLIDADALKKAIIKHLCVKSENNLLPAEKSIYNCIDEQPTIEPLKEKQPKEPMQLKYSETREEYWFYESICPKCGNRWISNGTDHFCPACGQPVFEPWEEEQKDGER